MRPAADTARAAVVLMAAVAVVGTTLAACGGSSGAGDADAATTDLDAPAGAEAGPTPGDGAADAEAAIEHAPPPPYARPTYAHLAETGLFADLGAAADRIADDVLAFEPTHKLWSDAAAKRRWVRLPPGTQIDTSDMDHWVFPVGTKLWKEFSLGGVLLETRLIERYGDGPDDYWMGAFVWSADGTDAAFVVDGQHDINGTPHDAPPQKDCGDCHRGDVGRVLGLSAVQMSRADNPPALRELAELGVLSHPPADLLGFPAPGDAVTAAALGYLHANCGHCHNENGVAWPDTQMVLRLTAADRDAATSGVFASIVNQPLEYWRGGAIKRRVAAGAPAMSALIARMSSRELKVAMPPLATEQVDDAGLATVSAWIAGLAPP